MQQALRHLSYESFEIIYRRHWQSVYTVCYHYSQSRCVAEDLVQDIFQSLWERRKEIVIKTPIENHLLLAAKLSVFTYIRTRNTQQEQQEHLGTLSVLVVNNAEEKLFNSELSAVISKLSGELPGQAKEVYLFNREKSRKNALITEKTGGPSKAIRNHLTKALNILRAGLKNHRWD